MIAMTPERWQRVKELFQASCELDPAERSRWLTEACAGDDDLRAEVEKLLQSFSEAGDFIERPPMASASAPEKRFGAYRVLRKIGHGGMGAVYLGVRADDQYNKRVAIKVVQYGDTEEILRRFRHERQILATLDHPHIAKLLDGGTTPEGTPYFVMDYVEGLPLNEYCDANRLPVSERLKLFQQVCSAVQYVHQNLVVHRDLKPGNILVTADGTPKLLDFGIAKLLKPEYFAGAQDATRVDLRLMTPGYASPEQIRGEPITTAGDVYSLGIVLYELLTGHRPYHLKTEAPGELARVICDEDPEPPSQAVTRIEEVAEGSRRSRTTPDEVSRLRDMTPDRLRHRLRGELDAIVMKAIRKEPRRRYASAEQLAEDIGRHLTGQPVMAHRDTLRYRTAKFIMRNRVGVSAAVLTAVSLLGGIVATTWQAREAEAQRARAERRFNDVRKLANSFLFDFHDAIQNLPGSTPARELVVRKALEYLDSLQQESAADTGLALELAEAYRKVGDVQGNPLNPNLGNITGAQESYGKALRVLEPLLVRDAKDAAALRVQALVYQKIADTQIFTNRLHAAAESSRKALVILEPLAAATPDAGMRRLLAESYIKAGDILGNPGHGNLGDEPGALKYYDKADAILESLSAAAPSDADVRRRRSVIRERIGYLLEQQGKLSEAEDNYARALAITQSLAAESPGNAGTQRALAAGYARMGKVQSLKMNYGAARENYRKSLDLLESLLAADPSNARARYSLAQVHAMHGDLLRKSGDLEAAKRAYRNTLALFEELARADPKNAVVREGIPELREMLAALGKK
jgi:non-specific serine/threonine protein kinase/serine/threonine-protein kinase